MESSRQFYTAPTDYVISSFIREYDISKANISILYALGKIDEALYKKLYSASNDYRKYFVGCLQRDNEEIKKALSKGFDDIMKEFIETNQIQSHEILSVKRDAIFLIDRVPTITNFWKSVNFICKNMYTSFYKLNKNEYYYYADMFNNEYLHIKGIGDEALQLHDNYFLDFLLTVFNSAQIDSTEDVISIISAFHDKYINLELEVGYYRNFDNKSLYTFNFQTMTAAFQSISADESHKPMLEISCNRKIITELYKIFSSIYFSKK